MPQQNRAFQGNPQSTDKVVVAIVQKSCEQDPKINLEQTIVEIRNAAKQGAKLVCLQELFNHRYFCQSENHDHFSLAESIPGPTTDYLSRLAKELAIVLIVPLFERRAPGLFHNSAVVIEIDGTISGVYRKMHIPDDPFFYEKFYFTPGDLGFKTFETSVGSVGVCICWDQWYPEAARLTALQGAQFLVYPTAIGWLAEDRDSYGESQLAAWQTMMRSHAIANGVYVIAPNRVGIEDNIEFWGSSFVADPYGNLLDVADGNEPQTMLVGCDKSLVETARTHWPFLRDRRIDAYQDITKRWIDS